MCYYYYYCTYCTCTCIIIIIVLVFLRELRLRDYRDTISRHVEGCESSDIKSNTPPTSSSSSSLHNSGIYNKPHPPPPSHTLSHQPVSSLTPSVPSPPLPPTSTPTTIFPVHLPQKIIPGFLKRLSMPTILKRSPEKPEKPNTETGDSVLTGTISGTSSLHLSESTATGKRPCPILPKSSPQPSQPLRQSLTAPTKTSRSSSLGSLSSTKAVTIYSKPLVSHTETSTGSKRSLRSLSMDSSNTSTGAVTTEMTSISNWSAESLSLVSEDTSDLSYGTPEMGPSPLPPVQKNLGFQFTRHFSYYSQFTSELALMHCPNAVDELWETYAPSPVWCVDVSNGTIVVGCGNGQIEVRQRQQ